VIFAWVEGRRTEFPVSVMCRVLGVSRAGYYAWRTRPPSDTAQRRDHLVDTIRAIHQEPRMNTYGSPRMFRELKKRGVACCENTVAGVMKRAGIRAKATRRSVRTTDSKHRLPVSPNVLDREFTATTPNEKWVMDLTYIPTGEGWLYLALVVDLFSRRIVGWAMEATMTSRLVVDALSLAVGRRGTVAGLIAHSDRGSQYASEHYQRRLREERITCSMSRRGNCWDNAAMESFFASLKKELVHDEDYATRADAKASIFEYIEAFYNRVRRHSSLGYVAPDEYERTHNQTHR
jgi:transposase InsO family protein